MPEILEIDAERLCKLKQYAFRLMDDEDGRMLFDEYEPYIRSVTAEEAIHVFEYLLSQHTSVEKVKSTIWKLFNIFYEPLNALPWNKPGEDHFLHYLILENREAEKIMDEMKGIIKDLQDDTADYALHIPRLRNEVDRLKVYELHYSKEENILFPYLDNVIDQHKYLFLLQLFHNDFRTSLTTIESHINRDNINNEEVIGALGKLFFVMFPLIFFEEQIVFPIACAKIDEKNWAEMLRQSLEIGWCFGIKPVIKDIPAALAKE